MAVVNIPFGGQMVAVEVPDFAMEATQSDILSQAQRQTDALQSIASKLGVSVTNEQTQTKKITDTLEKTSREEQRKNQMSLNDLARGLQKPLNQAMSLSGKEKLSGLVGQNGILGTLGFGVIGAQIGTMIGILEELGTSLSALRRVGAGVGADLLELRTSAASVGLGMETLAKVVTENGPAIRLLGDDMASSTRGFLDFTRQMQDATREAGYFGMGANEMAAFLVDELELRRLEGGIRLEEANSRQQVIDSLNENLKLNEIAASITGEDIQDRIKMRNEFRRQAVVAVASRNLSEDQLRSQNALVESMSKLGPSVGPVISTALTNMIAGLSPDMGNEDFTQLAAGLAARGVDIRTFLEEGVAGVRAGMNPEDLEASSIALAGQIKNIEFSASDLAAAQAGVPSAMLAVTASAEAFSDGTDTLAEAQTKLTAAFNNFAQSLNDGSFAGSQILLDSQVVSEQLRDGIVEGFTNAFNVDNTSTGLQGLFSTLIDSTAPGGAIRGFMDAIIGVTTLMSGAQFVGAIAGIGDNSNIDTLIKGLGPAAMLLFQGGAGLFNRARGPGGGGPGGIDRDAARQSIRDQMNPNSSSFMGHSNLAQLMPFVAGLGIGGVGGSMLAKVDPQELATALEDVFNFDASGALVVHIQSSSIPMFNNN